MLELVGATRNALPFIDKIFRHHGQKKSLDSLYSYYYYYNITITKVGLCASTHKSPQSFGLYNYFYARLNRE